jgi:hypothetical protein
VTKQSSLFPVLAHGCVAGIAQIVQVLDEEPTYR